MGNFIDGYIYIISYKIYKIPGIYLEFFFEVCNKHLVICQKWLFLCYYFI